MNVPIDERGDRFQGYRGPVRELLEQHGIGVWSEVEVTNDRGSTFVGVILPRSETFDDLHLVVKLFNGYNVGIAADRIVAAKETGYKKAVYKIPEKAFPFDPKKKNVTLLGTGGTIASRLDYRTGAVIPAFTPGELYGAVPGAGGHRQPDHEEALRRLQREHGTGAVQGPGHRHRRGDRRGDGRHRHRPRHGHHVPHRRDPQLHGAGQPRAHRAGGLPAQLGPALLGRPR